MFRKIHNTKKAFTLVEIMIVVAIVGLLSVLALPSFIKSRKQSQGRRIMNDVRQMDGAVDQWAMEFGKKDGDPIDTVGVATYLKPNTWEAADLLGNNYVLGSVGSNQVRIAASTKTALAGVGIDWGNY